MPGVCWGLQPGKEAHVCGIYGTRGVLGSPGGVGEWPRVLPMLARGCCGARGLRSGGSGSQSDT